jgi:iron complex outermembrane receptor protein
MKPLRLLITSALLLGSLAAAPVRFDIPAQPAPDALVAFGRQAKVEVLFRADELKGVSANEVKGEFEPDQALRQLLAGSGFSARQTAPTNFVVARLTAAATSSVRGTLLGSDGRPAGGATVRLRESGASVLADRSGDYLFEQVVPGSYTIIARAEGHQPLHITDVRVRSGSDVVIGLQMFRRAETSDVTNMEPFVVVAKVVTELDPFEVTGERTRAFTSRNVDLPRTVNDAQAYYMFDARDIDRAGMANLEGFLARNLPMQTASARGEQGVFVGGVRANTNLRGLGSTQTLILVNGRRSAASNLGNNSPFNLNTIPLGAIDRVEVLPSSASAIYGASAVGGVINVVLKRNYSGGEMKATYQTPFDTDAPIRKLDLTYGITFEGGRSALMLSAGYSDQSLLQVRDRQDIMIGYTLRARQNFIDATGNPASAPGWVGATPNIVRSGNLALVLKPAYGGASLGSAITYIPYGTTAATAPAALGAALVANAGKANLDPAETVQNPNGLLAEMGSAPTLRAFMATFRREMTPNLELNAEFNYSGDYSRRNSTLYSSLSVPANAVTNPFTSAVTLNLPMVGFGPTTTTSISRRITVGAIARLPHDWIAQADYTWSASDAAYTEGGFYASAALTADIVSGAFNPFVDTRQTPLDLSRYMGSQNWRADPNVTNNVALRLTGPLPELPMGTPDLTIGLERRQEGNAQGLYFQDFPSVPSANNSALTLPKNSVTESAYVETKIPLVGKKGLTPFIRDINLQAAWRLENFELGTGTREVTLTPVPTTPPVIASNRTTFRSSNLTTGITWRPVKSLLLRASIAEGFVPPFHTQLTAPTVSTFATQVSDPRRGGAATQVFPLTGGNPDLKPETSETTAVGVVFEPVDGRLKGLRLAVDYNFIDKRNNIATLGAQVMVDNEANFPDRITRGPVPPGDAFGVGPITQVNVSPINLLRAYYESTDVSLRYRKSTANYGNFDFNALGTFGLQTARKTVINTPFVDFAGYVNFPLSFTGNASLYWDYRRYSVGWSTRYIPRVHALGPPVSTALAGRQRLGGEWVASQVFHDLSFSYRFPFTARSGSTEGRRGFKSFASGLLSGVELQLAVYNLFNKYPAFDPSNSTLTPFSTYGDIRLRDLRISIKKPL